MPRIIPLLLLALTAGCSIGDRSPEPNYYLLMPLAHSVEQPVPAKIGVGPVRVADFLQRQPVVIREGGTRLQPYERDRWAEPLDQGIQRTLLQNLQTLTDAKVRSFPWRMRATPDYAVRIDVLDLDRLKDGTARLEATWYVENLKTGTMERSRREIFSVATADGSATALSDAYSALVLQLAQRVAQALATEVGGG